MEHEEKVKFLLTLAVSTYNIDRDNLSMSGMPSAFRRAISSPEEEIEVPYSRYESILDKKLATKI